METKSNLAPKPSHSTRLKAAETEIKALDEKMFHTFSAFSQAHQADMRNLSNDIQSDKEILKALVQLVGGPEVVDAKIQENRKEDLKRSVEEAKADLAAGLAAGQLTAVDNIGEECIIVGSEVDADGKDLNDPPYAALAYGSVREEFRGAFLGAAVGATVSTGDKGFRIDAVYQVNAEPSSAEAEPTIQ